MWLNAEGTDQVFELPSPVQARHLKVLFQRNAGGSYMEAGEVQVMGTLMGAGDAAPARTNWASKANGGAITKFTSQYDDSTWAAANLILSLPQPVRVSYLKVVFLKNGGGSYMEAGEVRAYGR